MSALLQSLAEGFDTLPRRNAGGLASARGAALEQALADGLPGTRNERWKYTPLRALERRSFSPVTTLPDFDAAALELPDGPRLVFANGVFAPALSELSGLPEGVRLQPLSQALERGVAPHAEFLARRFDAADEVFARLNAALATEGAWLQVAAGVDCPQPLHLVFISVPDETDRGFALRHVIDLAPGAQARVVEHHLALGEHRHLGNALSQIRLGAQAGLAHLRIQSESGGATLMQRTDATLAEATQYRRVDLELGAALSRHELNVGLHGRQAQLHANGVLLGGGTMHLDTRLGIEHNAPDTACQLNWRGLAAQRSRVVFHGGILIQAGADGTDARLSNKNLLLSDSAEIDTQPVLEIHADEVQAAHGATVGNLDPTALFYLRSRGLDEMQARRILTAAFGREALAVIEDEAMRGFAAGQLDRRLEELA